MSPNETVSSEQQFNAHAAKYASSAVHANGPSLPVLVEFADPVSTDVAVDIATGTGHTALAIAPFVATVTGVDRAEKMLEQAVRLAAERGISNASFQRGDAEAIPLPDQSVDLVTARHAPHHFRDAGKFVLEVARILKPGGRFVMVDQTAPSELVTDWIHVWEKIRDRSHFRQRTLEAWLALTDHAGLKLVRETTVPYRMTFDWWTKQSGCSEEQIEQLKAHARSARKEAREAFTLEFGEDGEVTAFTSPMSVLRFEHA